MITTFETIPKLLLESDQKIGNWKNNIFQLLKQSNCESKTITWIGIIDLFKIHHVQRRYPIHFKDKQDMYVPDCSITKIGKDYVKDVEEHEFSQEMIDEFLNYLERGFRFIYIPVKESIDKKGNYSKILLLPKNSGPIGHCVAKHHDYAAAEKWFKMIVSNTHIEFNITPLEVTA